ncbi:MAG TPA: HEAT repeat domain-containing protein [Acidobacteriaceae bacterium]|jgi:HEAT repeat protein|nr:HEAT repeat domain-containing protein [Acidobacteriaceae bacterium]
MNAATGAQRTAVLAGFGGPAMVLVAALACGTVFAQTDASGAKAVGDKSGPAAQATQADQRKSDGKIVGESGAAAKQDDTPQKAPEQEQKTGAETPVAATPSMVQTPPERKRTAWQMLEEAVTKDKRPQTRIEALAALGMLRSAESERMIGNAMLDADLDVRTAAALAAGQTRDPNLTTSLRNLLDDKEPQVAFTAAITLAKMGDWSGEDILMAVVDGDRKAEPGVLHGAEHKISRELHNPAKLAKLGAMQGAAMLLGPFGFGLTAIEFMRQSGGDAARAAAIEQIAQEKTEPIHRELLDALKDKDPSVRAAAAKALVDYHDAPTQDAVYALLLDPKDPARLTAAAAYLRIMGVPGPMEKKPARPAPRTQRRLTAKAAR